jgi:hypothetical protein
VLLGVVLLLLHAWRTRHAGHGRQCRNRNSIPTCPMLSRRHSGTTILSTYSIPVVLVVLVLGLVLKGRDGARPSHCFRIRETAYLGTWP